MKNRNRLMILLAVCVTFVMLFSGCSAKAPEPAVKDDGQVTIKFLHRWPMEPNKSFLDKVVADFEAANPKIKIDMQSIANDPYKEKIKIILGTEEAPDVFFTWSGEFMYRFVRENKIFDLTQALSTDGWKDSLMDAQVKPFTLDDKTYGIPYRVEGKVFFYNTKIFQENGLQVPKTWDEFLTVCKTLKSKGITPIAYGNQAPWASAHYIGTLNQKVVAEDVRVKDYAAKTGEFTDPGYLEALKKYQELIPYFNANSNALSHQQARQNWINGDAAMMYLETAEIGEVQDIQAADFQWDMFKFPDITDGKGDQNKLTGAPEGFVISANTKHPEEAIAFLKYLTGAEVGLQEVKATGIINGMKGLYNASNADEKVVKASDLINEASDIVYWLDTDIDAKLVNVYLAETQSLTNNETTPEAMMEAIKKTALEVRNTAQ